MINKQKADKLGLYGKWIIIALILATISIISFGEYKNYQIRQERQKISKKIPKQLPDCILIQCLDTTIGYYGRTEEKCLVIWMDDVGDYFTYKGNNNQLISVCDTCEVCEKTWVIPVADLYKDWKNKILVQ